MGVRPYVVLSVAMSVDGYIDDTSPARLVLSDAADLDRVDAERAAADAILVGANTVRRDDPRLGVRDPGRRAARVAAGRPAEPLRVVLTGSGDLDGGARLFTGGSGARVVYTSDVPRATARLRGCAAVVDAGRPLDPARVLADLSDRGVARLFVEGGTGVHTLFLTAGLADELHLVVAPFFVGDAGAPRFVGPGRFPHDTGHRMRLAQARPIGDLVLLRYLLGPADA